MSWICPRCGLNNVNANKKCADYRCKLERPYVSGFDDFDEILKSVQFRFLGLGEIDDMTPNEELYREFFNAVMANPEVHAKTDLELRAEREQLIIVITKGRAEVDARDKILRERKPKGVQGFAASINADETSTNAINTIKERQKRMSKEDKVREGMKKAGISAADIEKMMSAGNMLQRLKMKATELFSHDKKEESEQPSEPPKPFVNPFAKPKEEQK